MKEIAIIGLEFLGVFILFLFMVSFIANLPEPGGGFLKGIRNLCRKIPLFGGQGGFYLWTLAFIYIGIVFGGFGYILYEMFSSIRFKQDYSSMTPLPPPAEDF